MNKNEIMMIHGTAYTEMTKQLLEAADLDDAGKLRTFFKISLPMLSPQIFFLLITITINSFKVFREAYLLAGDYPNGGLYMLQNFINNTFRSLDYQKLSSAAILMSLVMVVIIGILFLAENHFGKDVEE